jgi:hypothetical protein
VREQPHRVVDVWFDPSCRYSWVTACWVREVERVRRVRPVWHLMSPSMLNEDRDDDPGGDPEGWLRLPVRVFAAVHERFGQRALLDLYDAYGRLVHETGTWTHLADVLVPAGLPTDLAAASEDESWDALIRASHTAGVALVGPHVGTPILATDGPDDRRIAWFGPVLSRTPRGEDGGVPWDGVVRVAATDGFKGRPHEPPRYDR